MSEDGTAAGSGLRSRAVAPLRVLRAVGLAFGARKVALGVIGLWLIDLGWRLLDRAFPGSAVLTPDLVALAFERSDRPLGLVDLVGDAAWRLTEPPRTLIGPLLDAVAPGTEASWHLHALLGVLWVLLVGGLVGASIARMTLLEVNGGRSAGLLPAARYAARHLGTLVAAPAGPLAALALGALGCAAFGLLLRVPAGVGGFLGAIGLWIPLGIGIVMAILLLDLAAAWPLLHASIAAEGQDLLDALSRSFGYVNQRVGKFVVLVALAWLAGIPALLAFDGFLRLALRLTSWGLELSAPAGSLEALRWGAGPGTSPSPFATAPAFWRSFVLLLGQGWAYAYYWTTATLIYLILRHDVDGTSWSEVIGTGQHPDDHPIGEPPSPPE